MERKTKIGITVASLLAAGAGAAGIATAGGGGGDDSEAPITGSALEKASQAALAETGGGEVTDTETGDEESYFEVEVTLDDGTQTDIQVNRDYEVVGSEAEDASETDD